MKYTQMVIINMKYQCMYKSRYNVEMLIHTPMLFQIWIVFWVVVEITER